MKPQLLVVAGCAVCMSVGFLAGAWYERRESRVRVTVAQRELALHIADQVEKKLGSISPSSSDYSQIKDGIHLYKDIDLAVIEADGRKSVKIYK